MTENGIFGYSFRISVEEVFRPKEAKININNSEASAPDEHFVATGESSQVVETDPHRLMSLNDSENNTLMFRKKVEK